MRFRLGSAIAGVSRLRPARRGASVVEFALVAPVLLLLVVAIFEFGRAMWVQQCITNAVREGGRQAVLSGSTRSGTEATINSYLESSHISGHTITMDDPATVPAGGNVTISVEIAYDKVSLLPAGTLVWMRDKTLRTSLVMRKEPSLN